MPGADEFVIYAWGLSYASVCTSVSDDDAADRLNVELPSGVKPWKVAADPTFATGETNPCPCPDSQEHRHLLFTCDYVDEAVTG